MDSTKWSIGWEKEQECAYQSEKRQLLAFIQRLTYMTVTRDGYVRARLEENHRKGFYKANVVITNKFRTLIMVQRLEQDNGEVKLGLVSAILMVLLPKQGTRHTVKHKLLLEAQMDVPLILTERDIIAVLLHAYSTSLSHTHHFS